MPAGGAGSSSKLRLQQSPNASGALFAQLEELTVECAAKDSDIKRLTQKLTAATAAADSESDQGLTQEDVEAAVSQACAPNTCLDADRSLE